MYEQKMSRKQAEAMLAKLLPIQNSLAITGDVAKVATDGKTLFFTKEFAGYLASKR